MLPTLIQSHRFLKKPLIVFLLVAIITNNSLSVLVFIISAQTFKYLQTDSSSEAPGEGCGGNHEAEREQDERTRQLSQRPPSSLQQLVVL